MIKVNDKILEYDYSIITKAVKLLNNEDGCVDEYYNLITSLDYDTVKDKCIELTNIEKADEYRAKVQDFTDKKTDDVKYIIAGIKVTPNLLTRYLDKYELASEYLSDGSNEELLKYEANDNGLTVTEFANLILDKHETYLNEQKRFSILIELFRTRANRLIDQGLYNVIDTLIEKADKLPADVTIDDIDALFV